MINYYNNLNSNLIMILIKLTYKLIIIMVYKLIVFIIMMINYNLIKNNL